MDVNISGYIMYLAGGLGAASVSFRFDLKNKADAGMARQALNETMKRYPYYQVKVGIRDGKLRMDENPLPVVVTEGEDIPVLNSEETNYHMLAVRCHEKSLTLYASHGMIDGFAGMCFMRTFLYEYCCLMTGEKLDAAGIDLPGEPINPQEYTEPLKPYLLLQLPPAGTNAESPKVFYPSITDRERKRHIRISVSDMLKATGNMDATVSSLFVLMLLKAMDAVYPDSEYPKCTNMALDLRGGFHVPNYRYSLSNFITMQYKEPMKHMDNDLALTCIRGMMILGTEEEKLIESGMMYIVGYQMLSQIPDARVAIEQMSKMLVDFKANANVSYVGKLGLSGAEPYVESAELSAGLGTCPCLIEAVQLNGMIDLNIMYRTGDDRLALEFANQLKKIGIPCEVSEERELRLAKIAPL